MRSPKSNSHYWKIPILLLIWLFPVAQACAYYELMVFKPRSEPLNYPYESWYSGTNTSTLDSYSLDTKSKAVANANNGGMSVFVWAWFGGTDAYASQKILFYASEACHVHGTVRMSYSGSAFRKGPNEWAGTDWYWALDGLPPNFYAIDKMFSFETVAWQIIDWALLAAMIADCAFNIPEDIALVMAAIETAVEAAQVAADMKHLMDSDPPNGQHIEGDFDFTVPKEGWHYLFVGFHAQATAGGFGTGGAFMKGQLEEVRLALNTEAGDAPDLIVSGLRVENQANIRTQQRTKIHVSRCNVGNTTAEPESWLLEAIPANGGPTEVIHASGAPYAIIPPYTTPEDYVSYVFTNKGKYTLHAVTDPEHRVTEIDETNNERSLSIYVYGNPPSQPQAPNWSYSPVTVHRNQSYNFVTASSDIDHDPISYMFQIRPEGSTNWISLVNRLNNDGSGWSGWSNIWLTPIVPELEFGPGDNSGVDPRTWWMVYTNRYYMRALAGDVDGVSVPSTETPIDVVLNTLPASMAISGNSAGSTLVPYVLTVSNYDAEGDSVGFRFKWGDSYANPWSEWQWCPSGQATVTVSHVYGSPSESPPYHYNIYVQATDSYADQHGGATTPAVLRTVYISNYFATSNILITTKDTGTQLALPKVRGWLQAGNYGTSFVTDSSGQWTTGITPDTTNCTVSYSNVDGYVTPPPETQILTPSTPNLSLQFTGLYAHKTGRIFVSCNVNGQGEIYGFGSASGSYYTFNGYTWNSDPYAWLGPYTVYFAPVDPTNYSLPSPSVVSNALTENGPLVFSGHYPHRPIATLLSGLPTNAYNPPYTFVLVNEETLALDASSSYSPETGPGGQLLPLIQYQFYSDDGVSYTESSNAAPDGAFDGKVQYVFRRSGRHRQVRVKVTDANGVTNWVCSPVDVWVKDRPGASFTLSPSPAIAGENISAHGDGTVSYPGDTLSRYEWTLNQGQAVCTNRNFDTNFVPGAYSYGFRLQASDLVWSKPVGADVTVVEPLAWPVFKHDERREGYQTHYEDRTYGQLPYQPFGRASFVADSAIQGSPVVANLDTNYADGLEIVFVSINGTLYVTNMNSNWGWSRDIGPSSSTPAIGDVDGDGQPDIVVGTATNVWCFDRNGKTNFSYSHTFSNTPCSFAYSMPIIADIDPQAPGKQVAISADDGSVHLIYKDGTAGTNAWPHPGPGWLPADPLFASSPAVFDLNTNYPGKEIIVGTLTGDLLVLNSTGAVIASFTLTNRAEIHTTPAIAKLCPDVDGIEIVFGADDGYLYCLNYQPGALVLKWQFPSVPPPLAPIRSSPVVGVLGEAGLPQVAFGCDGGTAYVLLGLDGSVQGSYNCGPGVRIRSTPVIANIDTVHNTGSPMGDLPELIFGADNGVLYAINFGVGASLVWSNQLGFVPAPVYSSPAAADIDHDPDLEILVGKNDGQLHVLKAQPVPASRPVADFAMNPASGARPLTVGFADRSSNSPNTWLWDFGDGATTAEQNPTHTYDAPGVYSVILTAANANGSRSKTNSITVLPAPLADFAATPLFGLVPLTVQFTNLSLYGADAWVWNFGNGTASSAQNPTNTYSIPGVYTVTLTASNAYGVDVAAKTNYITAAAVCPIANFNQSVNYGCAPLTVSFTDVSSNWPTSWAWDFGDGTTSTQQNPTHTYQTGGRYLVSLTASNSGGTDTKVSSSGVSVSTATVVSNFVAVLNLPFEEGTGAIAHDATTNLSNGTIYGAQWVANDQSGYALYFHGGGQWFDGDAVTLPLCAATTITNAFSVEARIKSGSSQHYLAIVDQLYSDWNLPAYGFSVYLTGGLLRFGVYSAGNGNGDCWGNTELRDNAWHVVKASWDGSYMRTYVDGNLQGECAWAYPPAYSTQSLGVGKRLSGWGGYMPFEGQIDYVIVSLLQTQEGPPAGPEIARWGDQIMIYWDSCGVLQSADEVTDQWTDVPGATNPYFTTPNASRMFYRLRAR